MKSPIERMIAAALPVPVEIVEGLADLVESLLRPGDRRGRIERAQQNALADVEDAAAEAAADALLKKG